MSEDERLTYTAQYQDWAGTWSGDGSRHSSPQTARSHCFGVLVQHGYSGVPVRVLEHSAVENVQVWRGECGQR